MAKHDCFQQIFPDFSQLKDLIPSHEEALVRVLIKSNLGPAHEIVHGREDDVGSGGEHLLAAPSSEDTGS